LGWDELPYPKTTYPLPIILSQDEVRRIIDAASDLFQRAILMTLYSTGMRCEELTHLTVGAIDSKRMVVRIHRGKGGQGPGRAAQSEVAGNLAGVLALDETADLSFPEQV
jgi:site-specific recombinase XerD